MRFVKLLFGVIVSVVAVQMLVSLAAGKGDLNVLGALPMTMLFFGLLAILFAVLIIGLTGLVLRWANKVHFLPATLIVLGGVLTLFNFRRAESMGEDIRVVGALAWVNCGLALMLWGGFALVSRFVRSRFRTG